MVRVTLCLMLGIVVGIRWPAISFDAALTVCVALAVTFFALSFWRGRKMLSSARGGVALAVVALMGYLMTWEKNESYRDNHLTKLADTVRYYQAVVNTAPEQREKSWRIGVTVQNVYTDRWQHAAGKVQVYIPRDSGVLPVQYGDVLLIKGAPGVVPPPANPHEFDYKAFLSYKQIYHQHFVAPDAWMKVDAVRQHSVRYYAAQLRERATRIIRQHVSRAQDQAIALALVIGVRDGVDDDLQSAYAASGAMHVLSVSGLHVGILYGVLILALRPLRRLPGGHRLVEIIGILLLWLYAFVTGLSPSVFRAVTMFSAVALGRASGRRSGIYNTLATSAFVLLIIDPYLIMSVGFQLSYMAVIGIVFLQRPLYQLFLFENRVIDWMWKISTVSLAAQAGTFALGLLYFHQFPVYFLAANLVVIPLATLVLVGGIALLVLHFITPVGMLAGKLLAALTHALNGSVFWMERLPYSVVDGLYINTAQCLLLMVFTLAFALLLINRRVQFLYVATVCAVAFSTLSWVHWYEAQQSRLVVFKVPGQSAVELFARRQSIFMGDSSLAANESRIQFHIKPARLYYGVSATHVQVSERGLRFFQSGSKRLLWVSGRQSRWPQHVECDVLLLSHNALRREQLNVIRCAQVVLDSSNGSAYEQMVLEWASAHGIHVHAVNQQGAFLIPTDDEVDTL